MLDAIGDKIRTEFGIEGAELVDAGVGQGQTMRFEVRSPSGRFMSKLYGPKSVETLDWIEFECQLLEHLRSSGQPVIQAVRTADGARFALIDGRPLLIYEWAEGSIEWPAAPARAAQLGRALAEMHLASDSMTLNGTERTYDIDRLIDRPLGLLEQFSLGLEKEFTELQQLVAPFRKAIDAVPFTRETFGPIHGDIHQGNCFFSEDGGLSVLDFALCGVGYRTYDLTGFLWPMRDATIEDPVMRSCCEGFLDGYRSVRSLTPEENAAIPAFVQIRTLWETGDWIDTGTGTQQPDEVRKAIPYLADQFAQAPMLD